ncbi:MAG TPA: Ku protein [Casimicrobiaceae bacterium]
MARALWKGAIVFGLVNIPVDLYPGARSSTIDLDWIDKRDMSPVGYQRINKTTGKPVKSEDIVKGYEYSKGRYVILSDEDFKQANPKATQTVDIVAFVDGADIDPRYYETPYRLAPGKRGEKPYALLREALRDTGKVGVAKVVIRSKQHLAALMVNDDALVLELLRWHDELLDLDEFALPEGGKRAAGEKELDLAKRLIADMSEQWKPEQYHDTYREDLEAQIERRVKAGKTEVVTEAPKERAAGGAQVIDLMAALRQSLEKKPARRKEAAAQEEKAQAPKTRRRAANKRALSRAHAGARKRA